MDTAVSLTRWFAENSRTLPWRCHPRDPYGVLVSELMLQQTQVERVVPVYRAFLQTFPSLEALAAADEDAVVAAWLGLGYYRRARLLHRLARQVVAAGGALPDTAAELGQLPGVGPYTAAAVASLAFARPAAAVDGNVARVAARFLAFDGDPRAPGGRRALVAWVESLFESMPPGTVNEALMELGATLCLPAAPQCPRCPLANGCRGRAEGDPCAFPRPRPRRASVHLWWVAACCVDPAGRWLLRRVESGPILIGLWLPPLAEIHDGEDPIERALELQVPAPVRDPEALGELRHTVTHRRIRVVPVLIPTGRAGRADTSRGSWMDLRRQQFPTSSLLGKLAAAVTAGSPSPD